MARRFRTLAREDGFTLIELLVVMSMLVIVVSALVIAFVSATNSQADQTARADAEQNARLALEQMRRDIHCATQAGFPSGSVLMLDESASACSNVVSGGDNLVAWCATAVTSSRYVLRRATGTFSTWPTAANPCSSTSRFEADYLTSGGTPPIWGTPTCTSGRYPTVSVDYTVNTNPAKAPSRSYRLTDNIAIRNAFIC